MNERRDLREALGLTQVQAASDAGVSLATWRRWEEDAASVSATTRKSCESVLDRESSFREAVKKEAERFENSWSESPVLTPRQASAISGVLDRWADLYIREWLKSPGDEPLHEVSPFCYLDLRVMMLVGENRAWAAKALERCEVVSKEIANGLLPFERQGCFFDELLMAMALEEAQDTMNDMPELFEEIQGRESSNNEDAFVGDDEWDMVSDNFDDMSRWDEWEVPVYARHPLLPVILQERHPFRWFDDVAPTGPGYLNRLLGIEVLVPNEEA